jgi:hypothetical protein
MTLIPDPHDQPGAAPAANAPVAALEPVRRPMGLALLTAGALVFAVSSAFAAAAYHASTSTLIYAGGYLYALGFALAALATFLGAAWARPFHQARAVATLVAIGIGLSANTVGNLVTTLANQFHWSGAAYDAGELVITAGDVVLGVTAIVLAVRFAPYRPRRDGRSGHSPMVPLLIGGVTYLLSMFPDVYNTTWLHPSTTNNWLSNIATAASFVGPAVALAVAAGWGLGPRWRLAGAAVGFAVIGLPYTAIEASIENSNVNLLTALAVVTTVGWVVVASVLLASTLLATSPVPAPGPMPVPMPGPGQGPPPVYGAIPYAATSPSVTGLPVSPGEARFCTSCGAGLVAGGGFCPRCGQPVTLGTPVPAPTTPTPTPPTQPPVSR